MWLVRKPRPKVDIESFDRTTSTLAIRMTMAKMLRAQISMTLRKALSAPLEFPRPFRNDRMAETGGGACGATLGVSCAGAVKSADSAKRASWKLGFTTHQGNSTG
jgi:hypothetical protein